MGGSMAPLVKFKFWFAYLLDAELASSEIDSETQAHLVKERRRATMDAFGELGIGSCAHVAREKAWQSAVKELRA